MNSNILNNAQELEAAKFALSSALKNGADAARVTLNMGLQNSFSVLDGKLDKLQMSNDCSLYIQLYYKNRYGVFSTNRMDKEELAMFIKESLAAASLLAEDKCRTLPHKSLYYNPLNNFNALTADLEQFDDTVISMDSDIKKEIAFNAYREIEGKSSKLVSATTEYGDYIDYMYMTDSQGFEGESLQSGYTLSAECSVKGRSDARPEAWWHDSSLSFNTLQKEGIGSTALERALAKLSPKKIKSGKYRMVVENSCASRLFSPIISALNGESIQQKNSFLLGKLGETLFPEHLNIVDRPHLKRMSGSRYFDAEGIATKEMDIIENGRINTYFINTYYANKMGVNATIEGPSVPMFSNRNYKSEYKSLSLCQLLENMDDCIFVTGFNGGNCNGTTGDFSYGVEGFLVKNGKILHPIREMNITGNMISLWNTFLCSADDARKCTRWQIPSLAFEATDFTGL